MKPYLFLNKLGGKKFDPRLRKFILDCEIFKKIAKRADKYPIKATIDAQYVLSEYMGSCPECGGRMRGRSGVHFDHEDRCIVCCHTSVREDKV